MTATFAPPAEPVDETAECLHCSGTGVVDDEFEINGQTVGAEFSCDRCDGEGVAPVDANCRCACEDCIRLPVEDRLVDPNAERWIPVPGWEGWYSVSNLGNVYAEPRTIDRRGGVPYTRRGRQLEPSPVGRTGHLRVKLSRQGETRDVFVHVLVLEAFVGPRPEGQQSCHADDDPTNNRLENLRWDTPSANAHDAVRNGRHPWASKTECPAGHPYDDENTQTRSDGGRRCRRCDRAQSAAYRRGMKELDR